MSKFALNLSENGRIQSATNDRFAPPHQPRVNELPEGDIADYLYKDGEYIYDPLPKPEENTQPTQEERIAALEAQIAAYEAAYAEGVNEA